MKLTENLSKPTDHTNATNRQKRIDRDARNAPVHSLLPSGQESWRRSERSVKPAKTQWLHTNRAGARKKYQVSRNFTSNGQIRGEFIPN